MRRLGVTFSVALGFSLLATVGAMAPAANAALRPLSTGFANAPLLTFTSDPTRAFWLSKALSEGAGFVRVPFEWQQVAPGGSTEPAGFNPSDPSDPNYNWNQLDSAVKDIAAHGLQPVLLPYLAPVWAQDGTPPPPPPGAPPLRPGAWKPDPTQFGYFAHALATRYSGTFPDPANPGQFLPHVSYYQAYNEPNFSYNISPAWQKTSANAAPCAQTKQTCPGWTAVSPIIYRRLLNAFYAAVKAVNPSDFVLAGGLAPDGDTYNRNPHPSQPNDPNLWRVRPLAFYRTMFCLNTKLKKVCSATVHFDAVDNHPYVLGGGPTQLPAYPDDVQVANMYQVAQVLGAGQRLGTVLPAGAKQIWASEISWATNPPVPNHIAVSPLTQAHYGEQAMYLLWRQHVSMVMWLDIRDMTVHKGYNPFFYGGLYFSSGAPKPLATSFRFPFVTQRLNTKHVQAWGRAPVGGTMMIEQKVAGKWKVVRSFAVATHQVFQTTLLAPKAALFRAQVAGNTSLVWTQSG